MNTLAITRNLEAAGLERKPSEAIATAIDSRVEDAVDAAMEDASRELATKADVAKIRQDMSEMRQDISEIKGQIVILLRMFYAFFAGVGGGVVGGIIYLIAN